MNRVSPDVPSVSNVEAMQLMLHHLALAKAYWEALDSSAEMISEMIDQYHGFDDLCRPVMHAWNWRLDDAYEEEGAA